MHGHFVFVLSALVVMLPLRLYRLSALPAFKRWTRMLLFPMKLKVSVSLKAPGAFTPQALHSERACRERVVLR